MPDYTRREFGAALGSRRSDPAQGVHAIFSQPPIRPDR